VQVHEHCWTVVRWAILAIGSGDSASRMLRFYSRLLEHFMGLDPRTPEEVPTLASTSGLCVPLAVARINRRHA
jgi:hypothetical protein